MDKALALDIAGITVGVKPTLITSGLDVAPGSVRTPAVFKLRIRVKEGLGIVDTTQLFGKLLYIFNATSGAGPTEIVSFTLTVE